MTTPALVFRLQSAGRMHRVLRAERDWAASVPLDTEGLSFELLPIGDEDLSDLSRFAQVRCLDLDGTQITDAALAQVAKLQALEELWIEQTHLTDRCLHFLRAIPTLRYVSVLDTDITAIGVASLKASCPALEVSF